MFAYENNETKNPEAGCFGAEKGFWYIENCLNYLKDQEYNSSNESYALPKLMKKIYNESKKEEINFLPADYFTAKSLITGKIEITENTYCIHNFAASWFSEEERKYKEQKQYLFRIFGKNIAPLFIFPLLILTYIKKYGFIIGVKKIILKIKEKITI